MLSIIPLGIILSRKPAFPFELRLFPYYIITDVILIILDVIGKRNFHNNVPIFHISTLFDVSFIAFIYIRILPRKAKNIILYAWIVFLIIWLTCGLTIDYFFENLNTCSRIFGNGLAVSLAIYHIMNILSYNKNKDNKESTLLFSLSVFLYYSCSTTAILFQDLPRYEIFRGIFHPGENFQIVSTIAYPILRSVQIALIVQMLLVLPSHITPRKALPKWLRFRLGWRPPTEPPQYRVLPAHLVG